MHAQNIQTSAYADGIRQGQEGDFNLDLTCPCCNYLHHLSKPQFRYHEQACNESTATYTPHKNFVKFIWKFSTGRLNRQVDSLCLFLDISLN